MIATPSLYFLPGYRSAVTSIVSNVSDVCAEDRPLRPALRRAPDGRGVAGGVPAAAVRAAVREGAQGAGHVRAGGARAHHQDEGPQRRPEGEGRPRRAHPHGARCRYIGNIHHHFLYVTFLFLIE